MQPKLLFCRWFAFAFTSSLFKEGMSGQRILPGINFAGEDFGTLWDDLFLASLLSSSLCCFCLFKNSSLSCSFFLCPCASQDVSLKNLHWHKFGHNFHKDTLTMEFHLCDIASYVFPKIQLISPILMVNTQYIHNFFPQWHNCLSTNVSAIAAL